MPYTKKQRVAACIAYKAKKGETSKEKLKGTSLEMYKSMSLSKLKEWCKGPTENSKSD